MWMRITKYIFFVSLVTMLQIICIIFAMSFAGFLFGPSESANRAILILAQAQSAVAALLAITVAFLGEQNIRTIL